MLCRGLTIEKLYKALKGDTLTLEVAIHVLVALARCRYRDQFSYGAQVILLNEALRLVSLSRKQSVLAFVSMQFPRQYNLNPSLYAAKAGMYSIASSKLNSSSESLTTRASDFFYLRNNSLIFPILSGLCIQYHARGIPDDSHRTAVRKIGSIFLVVARDEGDPIHILRALSVIAPANVEIGRYGEVRK